MTELINPQKAAEDRFDKGYEVAKAAPPAAMAKLIAKMRCDDREDEVQSMGYFWLEAALSEHRFDMVEALLSAGIEVSGQQSDNYAPFLTTAGGYTRTGMIKKLTREAAIWPAAFVPVWRKMRLATDCLRYCVNHCPLQQLDALLEHAPYLDMSSRGSSVLGSAVLAGKLPVVRLLIEKGASIETALAEGQTLLVWMAGRADMKMIQTVAHLGADLGVCDANGTSLPAIARAHDRPKVASFLEAYVLNHTAPAPQAARARRL